MMYEFVYALIHISSFSSHASGGGGGGCTVAVASVTHTKCIHRVFHSNLCNGGGG